MIKQTPRQAIPAEVSTLVNASRAGVLGYDVKLKRYVVAPQGKSLETYGALTPFLRRHIIGDTPRPDGQRRQTASHFWRRRGAERRPGRALGNAFHRLVFHSVECKGAGLCRCLSVHGKATTKPPREGSSLDEALRQRECFLLDYELKPLGCEVGVWSKRLGLATRVDELAIGSAKKKGSRPKLFHISLKTGYGTHTDRAELCYHQAQLMAERAMMMEMGVVPDRSVILYVARDPGDRDYAVVFHGKGVIPSWRSDAGFRACLEDPERLASSSRGSRDGEEDGPFRVLPTYTDDAGLEYLEPF